MHPQFSYVVVLVPTNLTVIWTFFTLYPRSPNFPLTFKILNNYPVPCKIPNVFR